MIPVILSGGSGTRLWPLSRSHYPKQFLPLVTENTMLQETLLRLDGLGDIDNPIVVCNEDHRFMVAEQLRELGVIPQSILLEPVGRNTAPAVAMAALSAHSPDALLLVLAADHVISDVASFQSSILKAVQLADSGALVTFGIVPTGPETGYGYIQRGDADAAGESYSVTAFVEKPDLSTATAYIDSGEYYWNSGMFVFRASRYLEELGRHNPAILAACQKAHQNALVSPDFTRLGKEAFAACPADSIDYAVMEKTDRAVVVPLDAGWNDVGSWSALWDVAGKDVNGNAIKGDVLAVDTGNSYLHSENKLVAVVGLSDMVVVETDDAVMVSPRSRVQEVKQIVDLLKAAGRCEYETHRKVYRPWGYYDSIDLGERHQAKRIVVNPGAKLSLQMHHHRAEHWIVVKGTASVTRGEELLMLSENQSTYIPIGTTHSLENPGVIPLEMVEVQTGSYLGEDDIVRFEDRYGRTD
ncbi:mannose-1-phosphate guanylyltransferase/mannose-6-phosphate isomerase [Sedimenticola selenatireducens]|uniref:mannose-1-phosphate guanylyltransferase n=1 Tax=Sedimenticola selenatireducens TaxID=191960 RepID=A0A557SJY4_9GAMM|nr:mannose-1-phosphate guanylyltransferase/mannose-6-phosphate isomerase [Sedimenticola selenatireducens]TVO77670.1 mannose-1-phosphate guanylyltransferase/mannose-6-phosphate isomerase [Sedimenticola selenatireducens]TVT64976.1 MAG: mannose-1-phosphate guanylyltransferase/mannose-6-phosphate isomerase [Sedimenticola selenatireducens]